MIYRDYGQTGKKVSVLGFGGMRFDDVDNEQKSVDLMLAAAKGGINYFDTAPKYFDIKSEKVFGLGLKEMRVQNLPYYVSTKTFESEESKIRHEIEAQLRRLDVDSIDFYHMWCITSLANWEERKKNGVIKTFIKLKEEGLINHICVSSHLIGDEIKELLRENIFEGALMGYSAYNFSSRQAAFEAITSQKLGCVVMNPLGGGLIPQNPDFFNFIKTQKDETVVEAALRFLIGHQDISTALVGFSNTDQVDQALKAVDGYKSISEDKIEEIKKNASSSLEGICTGCQYCDHCPVDISIPKYMDSYNQKILTNQDKNISDRLKFHWNIPQEKAGSCISCGLCEEACTQHLPIIERLKEIAALRV